MQIDGEWALLDDGVVRPIIRGEVQRSDGFWEPTRFLVDIGADQTVFSAATLAILGHQSRTPQYRLAGVGGVAASVTVQTEIRLTRETGAQVLFRGEFAAFIAAEDLDMSVLGRDITDLFAVIVDQPGNVVCLLGQRHYYRIEQR